MPHPPRVPVARRPDGSFQRTLESAERDAQACRLRARGWTLQRISEELGYGSQTNASRAVERALAVAALPAADELRQIELINLQQAIEQCWEIIADPGPLMDKMGRVVLDEAGVPLPDKALRQQAIATIPKLSESLRKLMGLDAPKRSLVAQVSVGDLRAEAERLRAEAASRVAQLGIEAPDEVPVEVPDGP